ncbi:MAG: PHP domain-containing protein [Elusimicrobiota bacterium]
MQVYRLDLHVHTPASNCFSQMSKFSSEKVYTHIVNTALEKKIDILGITDHHSVDGAFHLLEIYEHYHENKKLVIIPGVEITCRIDECDQVNILGYFHPKTGYDKLHAVLDDLKVPPFMHGSSEFVVPLSFSEVLDFFRKRKALLISARMDKTDYRRAVLPEIINSKVRTHDVVNPKEVNTNFGKDVIKNKKLNFMTFSDAHSASMIASRYSEVELDTARFESLSSALE